MAIVDISGLISTGMWHYGPPHLDLPVPPWRMVCFDVSNLGAEGAVAAVVASENGRPRRGLYRRMRMRRTGPDDFAMMRGKFLESLLAHDSRERAGNRSAVQNPVGPIRFLSAACFPAADRIPEDHLGADGLCVPQIRHPGTG